MRSSGGCSRWRDGCRHGPDKATPAGETWRAFCVRGLEDRNRNRRQRRPMCVAQPGQPPTQPRNIKVSLSGPWPACSSTVWPRHTGEPTHGVSAGVPSALNSHQRTSPISSCHSSSGRARSGCMGGSRLGVSGQLVIWLRDRTRTFAASQVETATPPARSGFVGQSSSSFGNLLHPEGKADAGTAILVAQRHRDRR